MCASKAKPQLSRKSRTGSCRVKAPDRVVDVDKTRSADARLDWLADNNGAYRLIKRESLLKLIFSINNVSLLIASRSTQHPSNIFLALLTGCSVAITLGQYSAGWNYRPVSWKRLRLRKSNQSRGMAVSPVLSHISGAPGIRKNPGKMRFTFSRTTPTWPGMALRFHGSGRE